MNVNSRTKAVALRVLADLLIVNFSVFLGLVLTYPFALSAKVERDGIWNSVQHHGLSFLLISAITIPIFYYFGLYTRSRSYSGKYKILVVTQAVALAHVVLGCFGWIIPNVGILHFLPLVASFISMTILAVTGRIWAGIWEFYGGTTSERSGTMAASNARGNTPQSVLVIGGAGYIGSGLLRKLLDRGYNVRLLDSFMFGEDPVRDLLSHPKLKVYRSDFRQIDKVVEAMTGVDAVVHIGAIVGDPACALDADFTMEVNLMATRMIAECAKGMRIQKFIFASTCSVYGASDDYLDEKSKLNPVSLYARSKIACEKILIEMTDDKFRPTILRFGTVYGLSGRTRFDLVVNLLTAKAIVDGKITVFGEDQWRPFVHVDDASLAVASAIEAPLDAVGGETFNVGADEGNMTLGDVGRMIQRMVPTAELISSGSDGDRRNYRVNFSKIQKHLGYRPQWTVQQGIRQVIDAFEKGHVVDYTEARYSNVKYLEEQAERTGLRIDQHRMKELVEESIDHAVINA